MKTFATVLSLFCLLAAHALADNANVNNVGANVAAVPQFAEARDTYGAPTTTTSFGDSTFSSGASFGTGGSTFSKPITYSSGHSIYSSDPGFSVGGSFGPSGVNAYGTQSLFPSDLINTGLSIVIGLFAFSLIMQIVTKVASSTLFDDLFEARSLTSDDLVHYTNLAFDAYNKYEQMNSNVPK